MRDGNAMFKVKGNLQYHKYTDVVVDIDYDSDGVLS